MEQFIDFIPRAARVLEFGAGTGQQARMLADRGFEVTALDLPSSDYAGGRLFPVVDYDGRHIPFEDGSVDVIFSSNVLEHVEDLDTILAEFERVTAPSGKGLHAVPTPAWRFWTFVSGALLACKTAALIPLSIVRPHESMSRWRAVRADLGKIWMALSLAGHGTSRLGVTELWSFSARCWRKRLNSHGFQVVDERAVGLAYTGKVLFGSRLSFSARRKLSYVLGSAVRLYVVQKVAPR